MALARKSEETSCLKPPVLMDLIYIDLFVPHVADKNNGQDDQIFN